MDVTCAKFADIGLSSLRLSQARHHLVIHGPLLQSANFASIILCPHAAEQPSFLGRQQHASSKVPNIGGAALCRLAGNLGNAENIIFVPFKTSDEQPIGVFL